ncbi:hypothetical protein C2S51_014236 [Perilla frutescens var. frutescens]|nr:hypothetical protein C2S51_014236 [Perilla frutescens var. frutescens]
MLVSASPLLNVADFLLQITTAGEILVPVVSVSWDRFRRSPSPSAAPPFATLYRKSSERSDSRSGRESNADKSLLSDLREKPRKSESGSTRAIFKKVRGLINLDDDQEISEMID